MPQQIKVATAVMEALVALVALVDLAALALAVLLFGVSTNESARVSTRNDVTFIGVRVCVCVCACATVCDGARDRGACVARRGCETRFWATGARNTD